MNKITDEDDGQGPYTHCQDGRSHCLDQCCACINTCFYRARYRAARGEDTIIPIPWVALLATLVLAGLIALCGVLLL